MISIVQKVAFIRWGPWSKLTTETIYVLQELLLSLSSVLSGIERKRAICLKTRKTRWDINISYCNSHRPLQRSAAERLKRLAGVSWDEPVALEDIHKFESVTGVQVIVFSASHQNITIYTGRITDKSIFIFGTTQPWGTRSWQWCWSFSCNSVHDRFS